jgi:hypothetical protein
MRFPDDMSSTTKGAVEVHFQNFAEKALRPSGLFKSILTTWAAESNVLLPGLETGPGAVYSVLISGSSVEDISRTRSCLPSRNLCTF